MSGSPPDPFPGADDEAPPDSTWPPPPPPDSEAARQAQRRAIKLMTGVMSGFTVAGLSVGYGCTGYPWAWWGLPVAAGLAWLGVLGARTGGNDAGPG
jgi:hypothetical protein